MIEVGMVTMSDTDPDAFSVRVRWDVAFGETFEEMAQRIESRLRRRRDGSLDMRFRDARWLVAYRKNGVLTTLVGVER